MASAYTRFCNAQEAFKCCILLMSLTVNPHLGLLQARSVTLQASVPGSDPRIQPMSFTACVVPSTSPYGVRLYTDIACTETMPTEGSDSNLQHIFKQPAGEKVWVLSSYLKSASQE